VQTDRVNRDLHLTLFPGKPGLKLNDATIGGAPQLFNLFLEVIHLFLHHFREDVIEMDENALTGFFAQVMGIDRR